MVDSRAFRQLSRINPTNQAILQDQSYLREWANVDLQTDQYGTIDLRDPPKARQLKPRGDITPQLARRHEALKDPMVPSDWNTAVFDYATSNGYEPRLQKRMERVYKRKQIEEQMVQKRLAIDQQIRAMLDSDSEDEDGMAGHEKNIGQALGPQRRSRQYQLKRRQ